MYTHVNETLSYPDWKSIKKCYIQKVKICVHSREWSKINIVFKLIYQSLKCTINYVPVWEELFIKNTSSMCVVNSLIVVSITTTVGNPVLSFHSFKAGATVYGKRMQLILQIINSTIIA